MARGKKRRLVHNPVTPSEEMRCCMYGTFGGPHAKLIAQKLYGNGSPNYTASDGEVKRVYMILKRNGISLRDWRDGKTPEAERFFNRLSKLRQDATPKLKISVA